jgi:hypothetical protein
LGQVVVEGTVKWSFARRLLVRVLECLRFGFGMISYCFVLK